MLTGSHITVRYGDFPAVDDVSFSLEAGQWLVAQGVPYDGKILLDGRDLRALKPAQRAREIGVLSQRNAAAYAFTVEEVAELGRYAHRSGPFSPGSPRDREMVDRALEMTGMQSLRRASMLTLSGGEAQRAFLSQVFAQDPRVLILDEPANHLDLKYQRQIFTLIREWLNAPGRAVLSVVHDLSLARRWGTHALLMDRGKCVCRGEIGKVLTKENLRAVYGMDVYAWMRETLSAWQE